MKVSPSQALLCGIAQDEAIPALVVPDGLKPKGLGIPSAELMFDAPLPPSYPLQPAAPPYDKPQYGADWTGLKPLHVRTGSNVCTLCNILEMLFPTMLLHALAVFE